MTQADGPAAAAPKDIAASAAFPYSAAAALPGGRLSDTPGTPGRPRRVGVLALQGDYEAHAAALREAGADVVFMRSRDDIDSLDAVVLPGGESTVMGSLMARFGMLDRLAERIASGLPAFGTCAGLILLAKTVEGTAQPGLRVLDATVRRNAYGRQVDSFRAQLETIVPGAPRIEGVFIRAPRITATGPGVETLASFGGSPVLVRQGSILGATFHPELLPGATVHRWFLETLVR